MNQPEGYAVKNQEKKVYKLKKAIYGLKQASWAWNKQADKSLKGLGFDCCLSDSGVYIRKGKDSTLVVVLYVDDILFMGSNSQELQKAKNAFMKLWECRDLGKVKEYLGMRINHNKVAHTLIINQEDYAKKIVKRFGLENAKPTRTALPTGYVPIPNDKQASPETISYFQQIIGSLLYLALGTRPDIVYQVILMSQFCANPSDQHVHMALYIVCHVHTTEKAKILFNGISKLGFVAFADADWAADRISRKSVTGYVILLAGGAISWVSRKQKTVALSYTEAEYMCMSDCSQQIAWIESLMNEFSFDIKTIDLCCDNQGAMFLASNPAQEHRSKHIDIRYHYIRECVDENKVRLTYIPTNEQIADIMTKNLTYDKIVQFRDKMGIIFDDSKISLKFHNTILKVWSTWLQEFQQSKADDHHERMLQKICDVDATSYVRDMIEYYEKEIQRYKKKQH